MKYLVIGLVACLAVASANPAADTKKQTVEVTLNKQAVRSADRIRQLLESLLRIIWRTKMWLKMC